MPVLQDTIHKIEVGGGMRFVKLGVTVLAVVGVFLFYNFRCFKNMGTQEAMDSAQLGRNLAKGKGFTTDFIRPFSMYLLRRHNQTQPQALELRGKADAARIKDHHPDIANPPVYPLVLAGLMKVLPFEYAIPAKPKAFWSVDGEFRRYQPDFIISLFNQCLFFATVVLFFFLVRRLFEPRVAWLAASLLFLTEIMWRFAVSGLSTMLLLLMFMGVVWCLVLLEEQGRDPVERTVRSLILALLAGALVGLGGLTRYSFGWLILPVLLFIILFGGQKRLLFSGLALVAFCGVMAPWIIRNFQISGTPFGTSGYAILQTSALYPENSLERSLDMDITLPILRPLTQKLIVNSRQILQGDFLKLGGGWISAFFLVGLLISFREEGPKRLRYFLMSCLVVLIVAQALGHTQLSEDSPELNSENLLVLLAPLVLVYGVSIFFLFLDQLDLPLRELRYAAVAGFGAIVCLPMIFLFLPPKTSPLSFPPYYPPSLQIASGWAKDNELIMTDMPWAMAWYGQSQSIWLTSTPEEFISINDNEKSIEVLFLTRLTIDTRLWTHWLLVAHQGWGNLMLQAQGFFTTDQLKWPVKMDLRVRAPGEGMTVFPLHYWQLGSGGISEQFLLTSRSHWPKSP